MSLRDILNPISEDDSSGPEVASRPRRRRRGSRSRSPPLGEQHDYRRRSLHEQPAPAALQPTARSLAAPAAAGSSQNGAQTSAVNVVQQHHHFIPGQQLDREYNAYGDPKRKPKTPSEKSTNAFVTSLKNPFKTHPNAEYERALKAEFGSSYNLLYDYNRDKATSYRDNLRELIRENWGKGYTAEELLVEIRGGLAEWLKDYDEKNPHARSIGHRTARIYRIDRDAWIRAHNPQLRSF
ncbi:hypothetical protein JCM10207_006209 [Rhodosporidiobolus poonsookiae]